MLLLDFLNNHKENWEEKLSSYPYCLSITKDDPYVLFKYVPYTSDMGNKLVQEARGSIFTFNNEKNEWKCVCYPFNKFFNAAEPYAATALIDWDSARVQQKVDGSLIKFWYHNGEWHISTNGTIDAAKAEAMDKHTYYELVMQAADYNDIIRRLDPNYTYMFELTSPYNKIVVKYENICQLWYLGRRNMQTFEEDDYDPSFLAYIRRPMLYKLSSLSECMAAAKEMDISEEGYVVVDKNFNRIKIKGEAYLAAHKLRQNGVLTVKKVVELWQLEQIDDFLAFSPEQTAFVENVVSAIQKTIERADSTYSILSSITEQKIFAFAANRYEAGIKAYLFERRKGACNSAAEYYKSIRLQSLLSLIWPLVSKLEQSPT